MKCDVIIPVGPGHEFLVQDAMMSIENASRFDKGPFDEIGVRLIEDTSGRLGRSKARNEGIKASTADWLFFLDADDLIHPCAFITMEGTHHEYGAVWGSIHEFRDGCMVERYQIPYIHTLAELISYDPYLTLQMGFFVRRDKMPLFDESMNCGEDWKAYLHLWRTCKCIKYDVPLMINRRGHHSKGPKAADGAQWRRVVDKLIEDERAKATPPA